MTIKHILMVVFTRPFEKASRIPWGMAGLSQYGTGQLRFDQSDV
jgi:hypothetical protein